MILQSLLLVFDASRKYIHIFGQDHFIGGYFISVKESALKNLQTLLFSGIPNGFEVLQTARNCALTAQFLVFFDASDPSIFRQA